MSVGESIHFNGNRKKGQPNVFPRTPRVNLNNLMKKVKAEEKKRMQKFVSRKGISRLIKVIIMKRLLITTKH